MATVLTSINKQITVTNSLTHSLTYWLTPQFTGSLSRSPFHHLLTELIINSSLTHSPFRSTINPLYPLTHQSIPSLNQSVIESFSHSLSRSLKQPVNRQMYETEHSKNLPSWNCVSTTWKPLPKKALSLTKRTVTLLLRDVITTSGFRVPHVGEGTEPATKQQVTAVWRLVGGRRQGEGGWGGGEIIRKCRDPERRRRESLVTGV